MVSIAFAAVLLVVFIAAVAVALDAVPILRGRGVKWIAALIAALAAVSLVAVAVLASLVTAGTVAQREDHSVGSTAASGLSSEALPADYSYVRELAPSIEVDLRYASTNNFTGQVVNGYESNDAAVLRTEAAEALAHVQADLQGEGLGLLVYDAFRPTRAVQFFMDWSQSDHDETRAEYYPDFEKPQLFELGYIAEQSGHSLGGTVDVTLIDSESGQPLDMGGPFDFFGERSHYETTGLTTEQVANRKILHEAMLERGFEHYPLEWWHFSFPLPTDTERLDFVVH